MVRGKSQGNYARGCLVERVHSHVPEDKQGLVEAVDKAEQVQLAEGCMVQPVVKVVVPMVLLPGGQPGWRCAF